VVAAAEHWGGDAGWRGLARVSPEAFYTWPQTTVDASGLPTLDASGRRRRPLTNGPLSMRPTRHRLTG
jgi:hypothetical protein